MARTFLLARDAAPAPVYRIDYARALNAAQHAAATAPGGPTLVVAGAGTGKTRTLVYRVAYLVESGVAPERIVLLTFTRRAAREMLTRAATLLDGRCEGVEGGTFHSLCSRILRRFAPRLGLPHGFSILDASDAADVLDVLRTQAGHDRSKTRFPRKGTLQSVVSGARNRGQTVDEALAERAPQFAQHAEAVAEVARAYARYKHDHALLDYDDLLLETLRLFDEHPDVQEAVAGAMQHVLVDEYQDTNPAQAELVARFASVHGNVTAVGDDAQSIYGFRGADVYGIFAFPDRFPGTRRVTLTENYRSTQPVLDLANAAQRLARRRYDKRLTAAARTGGDLPAVVAADDERTESRFVAQAILQMREAGTPLARMAVLFRSAFHSFDLEVELGRRGIPFVKYGGMRLAEAAHVKDVLAYLKVADNPRDAPAWMRLVRLLPGIGTQTALALATWLTAEPVLPRHVPDAALPRLRRHARALDAMLDLVHRLRGAAPMGDDGRPTTDDDRQMTDDRAEMANARLELADDRLEMTNDGVEMADDRSRMADDRLQMAADPRQTTDDEQPTSNDPRSTTTAIEAPLGAQVEAVLAAYAPLLREAYPEDHPRRQQDLDHLAGLAAAYPSRRMLLEALALDPVDVSALDAEHGPDDEPPLVLSTIHSAKGLEFDTVFLIHLLDGSLPSQHSLGSDRELDEEVRLFYVAVTRAERNLFLSSPATQHRQRAGEFFARPSRFLDALPGDILEPMSLVETPLPALPAPPPVPLLPG